MYAVDAELVYVDVGDVGDHVEEVDGEGEVEEEVEVDEECVEVDEELFAGADADEAVVKKLIGITVNI